MKPDIREFSDIQTLVNAFYEKVRLDPKLKDIFEGVIQDKWPEHLEKMYRFWQTILLDEHTYFGSPFLPHSSLPLFAEHFDRWITLFTGTLDEHFQGEKADRAIWQAKRMAEMFLLKINHYRNSSATPLK